MYGSDGNGSNGTNGNSQAAGNTQAQAASRSASFHRPMNPAKDPNVLTNYLARMLPLHNWQHAVYRLGETHPPGFEDGFCSSWEVGTALLPARQTTQLRINFQREFHLFGLTQSSTQAGGFRMQIYDAKKRYYTWQDVGRRIVGDLAEKPGVRLAGRGVLAALQCGGSGIAQSCQPFFLREPYCFGGPNSQALIIIQNQDTSANNNECQVALFGMVRRFNWPD
jgi:hypothetical protein